MKTFIFIQKNGNATITLSAANLTEALHDLHDIVISTIEWRVENEEGEDEDNN